MNEEKRQRRKCSTCFRSVTKILKSIFSTVLNRFKRSVSRLASYLFEILHVKLLQVKYILIGWKADQRHYSLFGKMDG